MLFRKIPLILICAIACVLFIQCGLEQAVTPWEAPIPGPQIGSVFSFQTGGDNFTFGFRSFSGYEVWYKIAQNQTDFNSDDFSLTNPDDLVGHGFKSFRLSTDTWDPPMAISPPLLEIDPAMMGPAITYTIKIDFSPILQYPNFNEVTALAVNSLSIPQNIFTVSGGPDVSSLNLRRAERSRAPTTMIAEYGHYKRFNAFYFTDADIVPPTFLTSSYVDGNPVYAYIAIYVYAYGLSTGDTTLFQAIKSPLCFLSYNQIVFYYNDENP